MDSGDHPLMDERRIDYEWMSAGFVVMIERDASTPSPSVQARFSEAPCDQVIEWARQQLAADAGDVRVRVLAAFDTSPDGHQRFKAVEIYRAESPGRSTTS